jgi:hypothetical protein
MQSRFDNGEVIVTYADGSTERLALNNPVNWWPIDQDYFMDDFAFRRDGADSAARGFADGCRLRPAVRDRRMLEYLYSSRAGTSALMT